MLIEHLVALVCHKNNITASPAVQEVYSASAGLLQPIYAALVEKAAL